MANYFKDILKINYEGVESKNPLSFRYYDENKIVLGKSMKEQLRFATCYWHTFTWPGLDPFGGQTFERQKKKKGDPIEKAEEKLNEAADNVEDATKDLDF